jgi:hypothetical protein
MLLLARGVPLHLSPTFFTLMQHWSGAVMCPAC